MTELSASASSVSDTGGGCALGVPIALATGELHLWLCHRDTYINSDAFKRNVLSRYAPVLPSDWQFALGEHGKPHTVGAETELHFNVSHSSDWLACAVACDAALGVDLEFCDARRDVMKLARRFFCADEIAALGPCDTAVQRDRFYDLWTLKEAAVKARGEALGPGLQGRSFALSLSGESDAGAGSITMTALQLGENAQYCLLDPLPGYRLALCSLAQPVSPAQVRVYRFSGAEEVTELRATLRASSWQQ